MLTPFQFWVGILALMVMLWSSHRHLHDIGCKVGVDRVCHTHWY